MTQIKPTAGQTTPRFADIATFFRLPVIKDLNKHLTYDRFNYRYNWTRWFVFS